MIPWSLAAPVCDSSASNKGTLPCIRRRSRRGIGGVTEGFT
jgi:hypothetical protein